jgi:mevalonate kinase
MTLTGSVPSKTFIIGEYLVLSDGRALIAGTLPEFTFIIENKKSGQTSLFHPKSAAGRFIDKYRSTFSNVEFTFNDPHSGLGGFGASSAQYIAAYLAKASLSLDCEQKTKKLSVIDAWCEYAELFSEERCTKPSGSDVVGQFAGGLSEVSLNPFSLEKHQWSFKDFGFFLLATGNKLNTHEHLSEVKKINFSVLRKSFDLAIVSLRRGEIEAFIEAINEYRAKLLEEKLMAKETETLINKLLELKSVRAIKGCGAMGIDVLFVVFPKNERDNLRTQCESLGLRVVADENAFADGARVFLNKETRLDLGLF